MNHDPITASRKRIADNIQQHFFTNGATVSKRDYDHVASILLQHEAIVREELIAAARKLIGNRPCTPKCEDCKAWFDLTRTTKPTV